MRLLPEYFIDRFAQGLKLIETDPDVMLAFKLTNETFRRTGDHPTKPKDKWRLFQIVFLVTQIPGIAARGALGALTRDRRPDTPGA